MFQRKYYLARAVFREQEMTKKYKYTYKYLSEKCKLQMYSLHTHRLCDANIIQ